MDDGSSSKGGVGWDLDFFGIFSLENILAVASRVAWMRGHR